MALPVPEGFRFAGVHCGIKANAELRDLSLVVADRPVTAAGVYTQNRIFAAPVRWDRDHTPSDHVRAVVINSGNANACTGQQGDQDAATMARLTAQAIGATADDVLVLSTGVIGVFLPMDRIEAGIQSAAEQLSAEESAPERAARGMMTTDTRPKLAGRTFTAGQATVHLLGLCKGAAMIGPNMATMLAVVVTDANLDQDVAAAALTNAVDVSFNCLSIEGHMSTNDTVLLLASGTDPAARLDGDSLAAFQTQLTEVCIELAREIADDGEGATHVMVIDIEGCATRADARTIAQTVANSALVKTAVHGADPNWGRIVSAAGYAGVEFDPTGVSLTVQGTSLYERGAPVSFDAARVSEAIKSEREVHIVLRLSEGSEQIRFWTTDLTAEYVRLNADYTT